VILTRAIAQHRIRNIDGHRTDRWEIRPAGHAGARARKPMLKSYLARLIQLDEKFYKIEGLDGRVVSSSPTFKKTGLHLSATLLKNYGFSEGDEFRFSVPEAGKIMLEKI